jgi:predicted nucleotidyltransferase
METLSATEFARSFGRRNQDVQSGIIQVTSYGRSIGYYISPRVYEMLVAQRKPTIFQSLRPLIMSHAAQVRELAKKHKVERIRLFGSVARGDDNPNSDIDFLVTFQNDYDLMDDRLALNVELEELFKRKVDLIVESELNKDIAPSVLEDAIEL